MNAKQYRSALKKLSWSQVRAAHELGFSPRSSRRYIRGERDVPETVAILIKVRLKELKWQLKDKH